MRGMGKSNIGYRGIGADGRPVDWYYSFNPGGFGCSRLCDGCWSHAMPFKGKCPPDLRLRNLPWSMPTERRDHERHEEVI